MEIELQRDDKEVKKLFYTLRSIDDVANILEIPASTLRYHLYVKKDHYKRFVLPKKSKGHRIIFSPQSTLKIIQRKLHHIFSLIYEPKPCAFGFIADRSILRNAERHLHKNYLLNIDLKDFFPSITFPRVRGLLIADPYGIGRDAATIIARLCCIERKERNFLPQGAPTSPIISNMIASNLDSSLMFLAKRNKCMYTRYADDISFSSNEEKFPEYIGVLDGYGEFWLSNKLVKLIEENGFKVNYRKIRFRTSLYRQEVTGIIVNGRKPNVKRDFIRNLRAMLHNWDTKGYLLTQNLSDREWEKRKQSPDKNPPKVEDRIEGKIAFLKMVKGDDNKLVKKMEEKFFRLLARNGT